MNKHCHRLLFNRKRAMLMVVAECTVGHGK
ncbi:MAG: ESPR-type extended signal peptide-containing protein, partial [Janthinobacterium lividum]